MSEVIETVTIDTENGLVRINKSDFNPDIHKLAEGQTIEQPAAVIESAPGVVATDAGTTGATAAAAPQRLVSKIGKKFFVVDAAGTKIEAEGIDANGYDSDADAWAAILPKPTA